MKILYDHQIFSSFEYSGISRYYCALFREFERMNVQWQVSAAFTNNAYLQALAPRPRFFPGWRCRGKNRLLELVNAQCTRRAIARGGFDVFHATYSKPYAGTRLGGRPYVITVHDLTHEKYLDELPSARREAGEEKRSIAAADAIIVPSAATRDDLIGFYPEAAGKITVIYHGFTPPEPSERAWNYPAPYFLYVGTRGFFKDFFTAAAALAALPGHTRLLCVGGGAFTDAELREFDRLGIRDRVEQRQLPEAELGSAYRHAVALFFPSRAEGFGLPVIEAQSQGCVPILADTKIFREIGAEYALYFPVGDAAAAAAQAMRLLEEPEAAAARRPDPVALAARFSWSEAARRTVAVYAGLVA